MAQKIDENASDVCYHWSEYGFFYPMLELSPNTQVITFPVRFHVFRLLKSRGGQRKILGIIRSSELKEKFLFEDKASEYSLACLDEITAVIEITQIFINM